jgi:RimJ/RimL family protein N-acetyltransferase
MDRQPVLEGERLLLRPLREDDWDALFGVARDPTIWAIHPVPTRWQEPVFRTMFEELLAEGGTLVVVDKAEDRMVGSSTFRPLEAAPDGIEIGWTFLATSHWGGSYNAEMKRLMIEYALRHVERAVFRVGHANLRSRRAMEKIGGRLTEVTEMVDTPAGPVLYVHYEITRENFERGPWPARCKAPPGVRRGFA